MRAFKAFIILTIVVLSLPSITESNTSSEDNFVEESWMGIYSDDKKIGYSFNSISTLDNITQVKEITNMKINLLGSENEVYTQGTYELKDYQIQSFNYEMRSDKITLKAKGKREGDNLVINLNTVSGNTERSLKFEEDPILPSLVPRVILAKKPNIGDKIDIPLFEPLSILMGMNDVPSSHIIVGKETVEIPAGKFETYRISSDIMGSNTVSWVTKNGDVVKQESPPGLTVIKESKEDVLNNISSSFNIVQKISIPSNMQFDNPSELNYLKINLDGIDTSAFDINDGYRQFLSDNTLEIKRNKSSSFNNLYTLPYEKKEFSEYTEPDFLIQSDDKEIVAITYRVLKGEKDPYKAAKKINDWIYKNLEKTPTVSLPNAKDVLKTKVGDCNEHAALFAAMARAAGIPTKIVLGTMYYNGSFYYHAWNEVYLGKWVAVDSTYGQMPADATHLKLIEGNLAKSGEILRLVGKLNIEIIDAS